MQGRIVSWFDGRWIIRPDGGEGVDVFCNESDLPPDTKDLRVEFDLTPDRGMFCAINVHLVGHAKAIE
jgi:hypothetical protein